MPGLLSRDCWELSPLALGYFLLWGISEFPSQSLQWEITRINTDDVGGAGGGTRSREEGLNPGCPQKLRAECVPWALSVSEAPLCRSLEDSVCLKGRRHSIKKYTRIWNLLFPFVALWILIVRNEIDATSWALFIQNAWDQECFRFQNFLDFRIFA